jgi:hypothetical protein
MLAQFVDFHVQLGMNRIQYRKIWYVIPENKDRISQVSKDIAKRTFFFLPYKKAICKFVQASKSDIRIYCFRTPSSAK